MPPGDHELYEYAAANRARLESVEREVGLLRARQHEINSELAALRYIGEKVGELAVQVGDVAAQLNTLSRRALERPTTAGWSALAGWLAVLVALVALIVAVSGHHG